MIPVKLSLKQVAST